MQDKLQEITQKIYNEGVTKANKEAEEILANANHKAEEILTKAKNEAVKIKQDAAKESKETEKKVQGELKQASHQLLRLLKQKVTNYLVAKSIEHPVKDAFNDTEFVKKILETVIKKWDAANPGMDINMLLPEDLQKELHEYFESKLFTQLNNSVEIIIERDIKAGFKIGPADGSYQITFKEDDFENLFKSFLRPKTTKILFEEE